MRLAIVGATGLVGRQIIDVIIERDFFFSELILVASDKSVGKKIELKNKTFFIYSAAEMLEMKPDLALFSAGSEVSKELAPMLNAIGCKVIDNSSFWRMNKKYKLIIPEINGEKLSSKDMIISNPNCSTIQLLVVLAPIHKKYNIERVVVSTYQSVSGSGKKAINQLDDEEKGKTGDMARSIFNFVDQEIEFFKLKNDGDQVKYGEIAYKVIGKSISILKAERLVLNCMQRMSGIASKTKIMCDLIKSNNTKILDTRKTIPLNRFLEKLAVKIGGGENHRFGLYDMIMIKDNHVDFSGGIDRAIINTQKYLSENNLELFIIVEARNLLEVKEIIKHKNVGRILLDNFSIEETKKAVEIINKVCQTESSGDINEKNIKDYADVGVDYISLGAITHSANNFDLSLKAK